MGRPKGSRAPYKETEEGLRIHELFLKPFCREHTLEEGQTNAVEGIEAFFNVHTRRVYYVRANKSFTIPGGMWASLEQPTRIVPGVGRRYMAAAQTGVLRVDKTMPDRSELEFEDQVFVLTSAHLYHILPLLDLVA